MKNFRDIEQLSAYLDGQLSPSESTRLESRIASDPELASAYNDIRAARGILRKLPARKAPRNFTLTRQMVGLKPPLPRSYSFFRFSTTFATILLMLTFAANAIVPGISFGGAAAPVAQEAFNLGSGGGCDPCLPPVLEAATEAPMAAAAVVEPAASADTAREIGTATAESSLPKEPEIESAPQDQLPVKNDAVIPVAWQIVLLTLGLVSGLVMFLLRRSAIQKWK
jgi:anti-sigma factor RsiW